MLLDLFKILNVIIFFILGNFLYSFILKIYNEDSDEGSFYVVFLGIPSLVGLSFLIIKFLKLDNSLIYLVPIMIFILILEHLFYKIKIWYFNFKSMIKLKFNRKNVVNDKMKNKRISLN